MRSSTMFEIDEFDELRTPDAERVALVAHRVPDRDDGADEGLYDAPADTEVTGDLERGAMGLHAAGRQGDDDESPGGDEDDAFAEFDEEEDDDVDDGDEDFYEDDLEGEDDDDLDELGEEDDAEL